MFLLGKTDCLPAMRSRTQTFIGWSIRQLSYYRQRLIKLSCPWSSRQLTKMNQILVEITMSSVHKNLKVFAPNLFIITASTECCSMCNQQPVIKNLFKEWHVKNSFLTTHRLSKRHTGVLIRPCSGSQG